MILYISECSRRLDLILSECRQFQMNTPLNSEQVTGITAGARRMRAHRQRRREGLRCVTLDLRDAEIERLIGLGHLRQDDRKDKNAVLLALYQFLDGTLGDGHH